jgi:hypothetical protein
MFPNQPPQPPPTGNLPPDGQPSRPNYNHFVTMLALYNLCAPIGEAGKAARRELAPYTHLPPMLGACDMLPPCMLFGPRSWVKEGEGEKQEDQAVGKDGQAAYAQSAQGQMQEGEQEDVWNKVYPTGGLLAALPRDPRSE